MGENQILKYLYKFLLIPDDWVVLDRDSQLHPGGDVSPAPVHHRLLPAAPGGLRWTQPKVPAGSGTHPWSLANGSYMVKTKIVQLISFFSGINSINMSPNCTRAGIHEECIQ